MSKLRAQQDSTAVLCRLLHHTHLGSQTEVVALLRKRPYQHLGKVTGMWANWRHMPPIHHSHRICHGVALTKCFKYQKTVILGSSGLLIIINTSRVAALKNCCPSKSQAVCIHFPMPTSFLMDEKKTRLMITSKLPESLVRFCIHM